MLLAVQVSDPDAVVAVPEPVGFDLARVARDESCNATTLAAEIVVCGRRTRVIEGRTEAMSTREDRRGLGRAEGFVGRGVVGRAYVEQVDFGQGRVSNRVMVGIRIGF
jgi:hypothetical protein